MGLVNKAKNIVEGWASLMLGLNSNMAKNRASYCSVCEKAEHGKFEEFVNDELKEIQGMKCGLCRCPLSAKLRSKNEKCPLGKW